MDKLTEVVNKYGNMVYRLAISYLKNTHDAQDIVQEVFIKYYNNEGKIQSEEHLKSWLLRVTINLCKNKLMLFWHKNVCSIDEIKEQAYSDNYEDNTVLEAVLALPVKYRVPIHLYYYENYKTPEIAKILGKGESTVRSLLSRGREKLKVILKEEYDFEW